MIPSLSYHFFLHTFFFALNYRTISDILKYLTLEDKKFQTFTACDDNEIEVFWEIVKQIDGNLTPEDTTKKASKDKTELQKFLSHC